MPHKKDDTMTITSVWIHNDRDRAVDEGLFEDGAVAEETWARHAACRTVDNATDLFFSEEVGDIIAAKRICAECAVIAPCLEGAIRRREPCGVWGGQLFDDGQIITRKRRRGRPPKVPRPEDQLPEVPIPDHLLRLIA